MYDLKEVECDVSGSKVSAAENTAAGALILGCDGRTDQLAIKPALGGGLASKGGCSEGLIFQSSISTTLELYLLSPLG